MKKLGIKSCLAFSEDSMIKRMATLGYKVLRPGEEEKLEVNTSAGVIRAYKTYDPGNPGIVLMFQPTGSDVEVDLSSALVYEDPDYKTSANERPEDVVIHTYSNIFSEDYTRKEIIRREDVKEALSL